MANPMRAGAVHAFGQQTIDLGQSAHSFSGVIERPQPLTGPFAGPSRVLMAVRAEKNGGDDDRAKWHAFLPELGERAY
jgi:hypothetical protein